MSSAVNDILVKEFTSAVEKDSQDSLSGFKAVAAMAATTYMEVFEAARAQFVRRGWDEDDSFGPSHQIAAQMLARTMNGQ